MQVTSDGKIISSGRGVGGLLSAWDGLVRVFTVELPRLLAALARIGR